MDEILSHLSECIEKQLAGWPEARAAFDALDQVKTRVLSSSGITLQFNPARIGSTTAKIDSTSIKERNCFLCAEGRRQEQISFDLGDDFELLVNPYPILREHFTVTSRRHQPQAISACYRKMIDIAGHLPEKYIVFYNGPRSGASAPDHLHLQIGLSAGIPLADKLRANRLPDKELFIIEPFGYPITVMRYTTCGSFSTYLNTLARLDGEYEPRLNIMAMNIDGEIVCAFVPRGKHRPDCYYADGDDKRLVSPGAIDMFGLIITPRKEDFERLDENAIMNIYKEVTPREPEIRIGIMKAASIRLTLQTPYSDGQNIWNGDVEVHTDGNGNILWNGKSLNKLTLTPSGEGRLTLHDVTIGKEFHWERNEDQIFSGSMEFITESGQVWAINRLPVEEYLKSVISSEMSPSAPLEFLKAHAVISRSWVLAQIQDRRNKPTADNSSINGQAPDGQRLIRWYDHDQHQLFDVCADDHCQRYQGLSRIDNPNAVKAVRDTYAETLVSDGYLCDARFSKCCGGISEQFETCWQDTHKPYLAPVRDASFSDTSFPDLTDEGEAEKWIRSTPQSFCSKPSPGVLRQVLNSYDRETTGFYRWKVQYSADELSELFARKSGLDIGRIISIKPLKRGPSGRIYELLVTGTKRSITIGKELEIRRVLSESHLYSSAFVVDTVNDAQGNAASFTLTGAGWGHGVGLCQIGAAVMGSKGYNYKEILSHYYPGATLGKFY